MELPQYGRMQYFQCIDDAWIKWMSTLNLKGWVPHNLQGR